MSRSLGLSILAVALFTAACSSATPAASPGATTRPAASAGASAVGTQAPTTSAPAATAGSPAARPTDAAGFPITITVEELCAALTADEMSQIFGQKVTIDPAETEWCGYDFANGSSGTFQAPFLDSDTAEEFIEQAQGFGCDAKKVDVGGAAISSCGDDKEDGRPSEAWFLFRDTGVQLSVEVEATEAQYLEMIRQALD